VSSGARRGQTAGLANCSGCPWFPFARLDILHNQEFGLQHPSLLCRPVLKYYQLAAKLKDRNHFTLYVGHLQILNCRDVLYMMRGKTLTQIIIVICL
jgi:hypothetical protein